MDGPKLIAVLGVGGMAEVFLAIRQGKGGLGAFLKLVVVKRLRASTVEGDALEMFHDEARISARLNHPNVVQTHEVGYDGEHYRLEMEYLDGQSLHRIVSRAAKAGRTISHGVAVAVVRDVLAGLSYAHELCDYDGTKLGIVHRDVSPQNIFVTYDGRVKLLDFGIAKAEGKLAVTRLGVVKGKMRYMAPEQAAGGEVDARADVFAAGVILWQLLVGRSYWGDTDDASIYERMKNGKLPPRPRTINPDVPETLDAICARALAHAPADRYRTADEFLMALEGCGVPSLSAVRTLGNLAAELFSDVREAIRAEIEKAASRSADEIENMPLTKLFQTAQGSGSHRRLHTSAKPSLTAVRRPPPAREREAAPSPERRGFSWPIVIIAAAALLSAVGLGILTVPDVARPLGASALAPVAGSSQSRVPALDIETGASDGGTPARPRD